LIHIQAGARRARVVSGQPLQQVLDLGAGGRCQRRGGCAWLPQDSGDDLQLAIAVRVVLQVDLENPFEQPAQLSRTGRRCAQFASHSAGGATCARSLALAASAVRHSVLYLFQSGSERGLGTSDLGQDVGRVGSPDERLGIDVVLGDVQIDGQFQLGHAGEAVAPDALVGDGGDGTITLSASFMVFNFPNSSAGLNVGSSGGGLLRLQNGSTVDLGSEFLYVARESGSDGTMIATGGSTITAGWVGVGRNLAGAALARTAAPALSKRADAWWS